MKTTSLAPAVTIRTDFRPETDVATVVELHDTVYRQEVNFGGDTYIQPAHLSDAPTLRNVMEQTFIDTYAQFNTPENMEQYITLHFKLGQVEKELRDETVQYLLMKQNEQLIGFVKLVKDHSAEGLEGRKVVELERIYVVKTHHGQKLGAKLMQASLDWSKNAGFGTIWLGVWEQNHKALAFYEKMGFQRFGEHVFVLGTEVQNDFLMKKSV